MIAATLKNYDVVLYVYVNDIAAKNKEEAARIAKAFVASIADRVEVANVEELPDE